MTRSVFWCFVVCLLITPFATAQDENAERRKRLEASREALASLKPFLGQFASEVWTNQENKHHGQGVTDGYGFMGGALLVFDTRIRTTSNDNQLQQISEVPFSRALMQRTIVFHDAKRGLVYHRLHAGWGMYDHGTVKHEPNGTLTFLSSEPPTGYFGDLRRVQWNLAGDTLEVRGAPASEKLPEKPNWRVHRVADESSVQAIPLDRSRLRPPTTVSPEEQQKRAEARQRVARMFEPFGHLSTDYYETSVQEHLNARGENRFFVQFLRLVRLSPSRTSLTFSFNVRRQSAELPKEDLLKKSYTNTGRVFVMEMIHWNHRKQRMQETILNPFDPFLHGAWVRDVQLTPEHKIVVLPGQAPYNTIATFTFHQDGFRIERTDKDGKPEPIARSWRAKETYKVVPAEKVTGLTPKP